MSTVLMSRGVTQLIFSPLCSSHSNVLSSPVVWRLKFHLSFRPLMYIVRVSSLLLTPLQAVFWEKVFGRRVIICSLFSAMLYQGGIPPLSLHLFLPLPALSQWQQTPCSCFCDSSIVSNELRRIPPQEEWQPLVMFPPLLLLRSNHTHS